MKVYFSELRTHRIKLNISWLRKIKFPLCITEAQTICCHKLKSQLTRSSCGSNTLKLFKRLVFSYKGQLGLSPQSFVQVIATRGLCPASHISFRFHCAAAAPNSHAGLLLPCTTWGSKSPSSKVLRCHQRLTIKDVGKISDIITTICKYLYLSCIVL